jgi:AcrR family transcriptional regulator
MLITTSEDDPAFQGRRHTMARRLLPVMEGMLDDESFTEISVERLVNEAGVSRSSFYNHFVDKGDLLRLMTEDVMGDLFAVARDWWDLGPGSTPEDVRASLAAITDAYGPHSKLMSSVVEAASYDPEVASAYQVLMATAQASLKEHIVRGQAAGFVRPDVDPDTIPAWLAWMLERGLVQLVATVAKPARERLVTAVSLIVWRTLYLAKED